MLRLGLSSLEISLVLILLSPYFAMVFMSSKIYFVNHLIKQCFLKLEKDSKSAAVEEKMRIKTCAVDFRRLNNIFVAFNNSNAVTIPALICFSIVNIVFEVGVEELSLSTGTSNYIYFQGYFLYPSYESILARGVARPLLNVCHIAFNFVLPYLLSLFWLIKVFQEIKSIAESCTFRLNPKEDENDDLQVKF